MERSKLIRIHIDDDKRQVVNVITYLKYSYEEGYVKVKATLQYTGFSADCSVVFLIHRIRVSKFGSHLLTPESS